MTSPILVRGLSRSGGTLTVTLLDSHPDVAMSYELYPGLLESVPEEGRNLRKLRKLLGSRKEPKKIGADLKLPEFGKYLGRLPRGGLSMRETLEILDEHLDSGYGFSRSEDRLKFIEECCKRKMGKQGKSRWGVKCTNGWKEYLNNWPDAFCINMIRDGRDVLASQITIGTFNKSPAEVGKGWMVTHQLFLDLLDSGTVNAYPLSYEKLVTAPEQEVRKLCGFLKLEFDSAMLRFHEQPLTIYGANHLSMRRIVQPIDASKVGQWKVLLTPEQVREFEQVAGDTLLALGY